MSPEAMKGRYTAAGDIWSLGVTMFFLFTGKYPFNANSFDQLKYEVIKGQFNMPKFLSKECKDLLSKMLNVNPNKRFTAAQVMDHKWIKSQRKIDISKKQNSLGTTLKCLG